MFKKIALISAALIFAIGILGTSVYRISAQAVVENLENNLDSSATETGMAEAEEATMEAQAPVEYALTWPGILPDHFLYPVKMIRDRIWLFLTTGALKKAELLLKQADKRIWSAQMLINKGKEDLAVSTATKAEKYLEKAVEQTKVAEEKGKEVGAQWENISLAALKHEEVLLEIKEKASDSTKEIIDSALEYPRRILKEIEEKLGD